MANDTIARALAIAALDGGGQGEAGLVINVQSLPHTLTSEQLSKVDEHTIIKYDSECYIYGKVSSGNSLFYRVEKSIGDTQAGWVPAYDSYIMLNNSTGALTGVYSLTTGYLIVPTSLATSDGKFVPVTEKSGSNYSLQRYNLANKQDTLTAGSGISIVDNVISATGGGTGAVQSVNGQTGTVVLDAEDVGALPSSTSIPTKTSDLTNDSGFLTEHQSLSAYRTSAAQDVIDAGKQATLTAGTNITIDENNVISATGGGSSYTFTNGLTESGGTVSWDLNDRLIKGVGGSKTIVIGDTTSNHIRTSGNNNLTVGQTTNNYNIYNGGYGSIAFGVSNANANFFASDAGNGIGATSHGSVAGGYVSSINGKIKSKGAGSVAIGYIITPTGEINAFGNGSVAIGKDNLLCSAEGAQCFGMYNTNRVPYSMVLGEYSIENDSSSNKAFVIGNGTSDSSRSNALTVDWSGNLVCNNIPAPPTGDGNYVLKCSIVSGVASYSWVSE